MILGTKEIGPLLECTFTKAADSLGLLTGQYREGVRYEERLLNSTLHDPRYLASLQTPAMALMEAALYETDEMTEGQLADSLLIAYGFLPGFTSTLSRRFKRPVPAIESDMRSRIASLYGRSQDKHKRAYHRLLASDVRRYAACMRRAGEHLRENDDVLAMQETIETAIAKRMQEMPQIITIDDFLN